jgi:hypothetical protein
MDFWIKWVNSVTSTIEDLAAGKLVVCKGLIRLLLFSKRRPCGGNPPLQSVPSCLFSTAGSFENKNRYSVFKSPVLRSLQIAFPMVIYCLPFKPIGRRVLTINSPKSFRLASLILTVFRQKKRHQGISTSTAIVPTALAIIPE